MKKKSLPKITEAEIKAKGVASLADNPNAASAYGVGGLTAQGLKLWFDQLPKYIAQKLNAIQDVLSGDEAANYISLNLKGLDASKESEDGFEYCLQDLIDSLKDGSFADYVMAYQSAGATEKKSLQAIFNSIAQSLSTIAESVSTHTGKTDNPHNVTKAQVGLNKVDNTADAEKSVAEAVKATKDGDGRVIKDTYCVKMDFVAHKNSTSNPHNVTAAQVGLGNVDNTPDSQKQVASSVKATQDSDGNVIKETYATQADLQAVKTIAEGRERAVAYSTETAMKQALKAASATEFKVGDTLYIVAKGVPDYWITNVLSTNTGEYGYYEISVYEAEKPDLEAFKNTLAKIARTGKVIDLDKGVELNTLLERDIRFSAENLNGEAPSNFAASPESVPSQGFKNSDDGFSMLRFNISAYQGLLAKFGVEKVTGDWFGYYVNLILALKMATDTTLGGIKVGFEASSDEPRKYPVVLDDNGKAYVLVPWEERVQTNWDEKNPNSPAYLQNKPNVVSAASLFVYESETAEKARGYTKGGLIDRELKEIKQRLLSIEKTTK